MKWASLENRSITVRMVSFPLAVIGRLVMKSQLIDSHGLVGVGRGSSNPGVFLLESFCEESVSGVRERKSRSRDEFEKFASSRSSGKDHVANQLFVIKK